MYDLMRRRHVAQSPAERTIDGTVNGLPAPILRIEDSPGWWNHVVCGQERRGTEATDFGTANDRRNIVIGVNVDGVVPFKRSQNSYTPIQVMIYNLPENYRHRKPFVLIAGMIPGPKAPKSVRPYLSIFVAELNRLDADGFGVVVTDPKEKKSYAYQLKVKLLFTSCDLPAHADNNEHQPPQSTYGCIKCVIQVGCNNLRQFVMECAFCNNLLLLAHPISLMCSFSSARQRSRARVQCSMTTTMRCTENSRVPCYALTLTLKPQRTRLKRSSRSER
jgi:hypothetical protein